MKQLFRDLYFDFIYWAIFIKEVALMQTTKFDVVVSGSVLYVSKDVLIADAIAHDYRRIGWKSVKVIERKESQWPRILLSK
jgi:hypothetical protein